MIRAQYLNDISLQSIGDKEGRLGDDQLARARDAAPRVLEGGLDPHLRHSPKPYFIGLTVRLFGWFYSLTLAKADAWAAALVDEFGTCRKGKFKTALLAVFLRALAARCKAED